MKSCQVVGFWLLSAQMLWAGLNTNSSTATMKVYEAGADKLTVYTDVPGHTNSVINGYPSRAKSDIYEIWVRSAATDNVWVQCFANMTYNRGLEMPVIPDFETATASHAYQKHTKGWTHSYANIEMSTNSPVEVEIRKIGSTLLNSSNVIFKSAVHPAHKVSSQSNYLGRVYFTVTNPCQVVIDINGQMDDHNAAFPSGTPGGAMPGNPPVHSIAFYANPIMTKPVASPTNTIVTVTPNQSSPTSLLTPPDPATYDTLVFAPGVHHIGPGFKVHPGKSYYLPGDAILYGNMNNEGVAQDSFRSNGDRINIFGYGTICGILIPHYQNKTHDDTTNGIPNPEYPEYFGWPEPKDGDVGIRFENAWDIKVTGITTIDPANFNTKIDGKPGRTNDQSLVSWVKVHSWRVNGDGIGGYTKVEDSFIRASDDSTYVRDWRRRCTFWKDSNANIFRFAWSSSGGVEDCDILYARWRATGGVGNVFEFAYYSEESPVLTFRNIRYHDKLSNPRQIIGMDSTDYVFTNLTFENISFYTPLNNQLSIIEGTEAAPFMGRVMFTNVTFQNGLTGSAPVRLNQGNFTSYFTVNEFVYPSIFEPATTPPVNFTLTNNAVNGRITLSPAGGLYATGLVVTVTAVANSGYMFDSWGGNLTGSVNPTTLTMNGNKSVTATFIKTPNGIRLNCGGPNYTNQDGVYVANNIASSYTTTQPIDYTLDDTLYQSETYGATLNYDLPLPNGNYEVTLMFAEIAKNGPGQRLFNVSIEGTQVITNLDIFSKAGKKYAAYNETHNVTVSDGQLNLAFVRSVDNAKISAIRVVPTHFVLATSATNGWITLNPPPVGGLYTNGTVVTLTAMASNGYTFGSWSGDLAGSTNPATITMNENQSVTANFYPAPETPPWVETFTMGDGATNDGYPTSWAVSPANGSFRVLSGEMAFNSVGTDGVFTTGPINISSGPVNVSMKVRGGTGLDVGQDFLRLYKKVDGGAEVQMAAADGPQAATTWAGSIPTGSNLVLVIRTHVTTTSEYYYFDDLQVTNLPVAVPTYTLTTSATNGTIMLNPPGGVYTNGAVVTVTANPNGGYAFGSWGGNLTGSVNPTNITMTGNKNVTASFALKPLVATISPIGSGGGFEISASNLEPSWAYELQEKTTLTLPWNNVSGTLRSNVTAAVWTNAPLPGEPAKFFRVIKRD